MNVERNIFQMSAVLVLLAVALVGNTVAEPLCDEAALVPPPGDGPVKVRASFDLQNVHLIDDETETFEFSGIIKMVWKDSRLAFNPAQAGCQEKVYNGAFQFNRVSPGWYPQLVLANTAGIHKSHGIVQRVKPDGICTLYEMLTISAKTKFDLKKYPYDTQNLEAVVEILGFEKDEVVLEPGGVTGYRSDLSLRVPVPQWKLVDIAMTENHGSGGNHSSIIMTVTMSRKWLYIVRLVVIPLLVICMLSWSVFWMEQSSLGDRMSASFVGILTAVAYQTLVGDILPQIAYATFIHAFLAISFLIMCASAVINLVVGACDKKGLYDFGKRIDRHCRWAFPLSYALLLLAAFFMI